MISIRSLFIGTLFAFCGWSAGAEVWSCEIQDEAGVVAFFDSGSESFWIEKGGDKKELITPKSLSSWKMPRDKCEVQSSFDKGEKYDLYSLTYRCSHKLGGSLQFDFLNHEGFYREDLYQGNTRHLWFLKQCGLAYNI